MESKNQDSVLYDCSMHSNHSKLSDTTTGKLSEKSQYSNNGIINEWRELSTCGFYRIEKSCCKSRPAIIQGYKECVSDLHLFLVKLFDFV